MSWCKGLKGMGGRTTLIGAVVGAKLTLAVAMCHIGGSQVKGCLGMFLGYCVWALVALRDRGRAQGGPPLVKRGPQGSWVLCGVGTGVSLGASWGWCCEDNEIQQWHEVTF